MTATEPLEKVLTGMLEPIRHRGPDDAGFWCDPLHGLGLGMRRLSVVDLAGGHQPMWNEDGSIGVVFNGEIYNHDDLRRELLERGHSFASRSDTEVLVHLYEEDGFPHMLERLRGMFAFALVDRRERRLFLARDPFGMKPLYLSRQRGVLAFASEAKSVRAAPGFVLTPDPESYLDYVAWLSLPAPKTHWREVEKLRPGEWQEWNISSHTLVRFGVARAPRFTASSRFRDARDAMEALDHALEDSVCRHLQADVPVGILLSGGLDSQTIGFYSNRATRGALHTFTAGFRDGESEFAAARATSMALGSIHHEVEVQPATLGNSIDRVAWHLDEPIGDPAAHATWCLCAEARKHVTVVLSGEGSDELFGGYSERYAGIVRTLARSAWLRRTLGWLPSPGYEFASSRWGAWRTRAHLSSSTELVGLRIEGAPRQSPALLSADHRRAIRKRQQIWAESIDFGHGDALSACQEFDLSWQLPESLLMKADKMGMAASVELRCPFLDRAVADVALQIPAEWRIRTGPNGGKFILRQTLARHAPEGASRPKLGFALPIGRWLRGPLQAAVSARLLDPASMAVQFFGRAKLEEAWDDFVARKQNSAHLFYSLWLYEAWLAQQRT